MPRNETKSGSLADQLKGAEFKPTYISAEAWAKATKAATSEMDASAQTDEAVDGIRLEYTARAKAENITLKKFAGKSAKTNDYRAETAAAFRVLFPKYSDSAIADYQSSFWLCFVEERAFMRSAAQLARKAKGPDQSRNSPVISLSKEAKKFDAAGANICTLLDNPRIPAMDLKALCNGLLEVQVADLVALILSHVTEGGDDAE